MLEYGVHDQNKQRQGRKIPAWRKGVQGALVIYISIGRTMISRQFANLVERSSHILTTASAKEIIPRAVKHGWMAFANPIGMYLVP